MVTIKLTKSDVEEKPYCIWNAFVELLASHDYNELSPRQRAAHLVFWYESEVQNGGHLQFSENRSRAFSRGRNERNARRTRCWPRVCCSDLTTES